MFLDITLDGDNITISHDAVPHVFTIDRIGEIVGTFGTYYKELDAPHVDLPYSMQYERLRIGPPVKPDGSYYWDDDFAWLWPYHLRWELYRYIEETQLFPITFHVPAIDVATTTARWLQEISIEDLWKYNETLHALDAVLIATDMSDKDARAALMRTIFQSCNVKIMEKPLCEWIYRYAAVEHGICATDKSRCQPCVYYHCCWAPEGQQNLYQRLVIALHKADPDVASLNEMKAAIIAAIPAREALALQTIGRA